MKKISEEDALRRLEALCAKAEKCSGDADGKMRQWGLPADARQRVIDRLVDGRYIDDERYACAFVRDKVAFDLWGPMKIERALWAKRLAPHIISDALAQIDDGQWRDTARRALSAKIAALAATGDPSWRAKAARQAMQRGFSYDMLRPLLGNADTTCCDD